MRWGTNHIRVFEYSTQISPVPEYGMELITNVLGVIGDQFHTINNTDVLKV